MAIGRRSKSSHLAHLICELFERLQLVKRTQLAELDPTYLSMNNETQVNDWFKLEPPPHRIAASFGLQIGVKWFRRSA